VVRNAKAGEKIPLLDNTVRDLQENMLVIADEEKPVALAGIMGGSNSQVLGESKNLLLESALFIQGRSAKPRGAWHSLPIRLIVLSGEWISRAWNGP